MCRKRRGKPKTISDPTPFLRIPLKEKEMSKQIDAKELKNPKYLKQMLDFLRERYGIRFRMTGEDSGVCKCPFHSERKPSFKFAILDDKVVFRCFGKCASSYDIFNLIEKREGTEFVQAIAIFSDYLKTTAKGTKATKPDQRGDGKHAPVSSSTSIDTDFDEELEFAAKTYRDILLHGDREVDAFLEYLAKRGVNTDEIIDFGIGVSPSYKSSYNGRALCDAKDNRWHWKDGGRLMVGIRGRSILTCLRAKGVKYKIADKFACKIVFPVRGLDGRIKALMGRNAKDKGLWSTHTGAKKSRLLYGLDRNARNIIRSRTVILTEGIYDFFALHKVFKDPDLHSVVVSTLGPVTREQVKMLKRLPELLGTKPFAENPTEEEIATLRKTLEVENYVAAFDNDEAGEGFLDKLVELVGPDKNVFRMDMLRFKDANEAYRHVPPFLDLNGMLKHLKTAKETIYARERQFSLLVPGGLKGSGGGLGVALKVKLYRKAGSRSVPPPQAASAKPANVDKMHFDGNRLKRLLSYGNDRMPKSRIKDIEALFNEYAAAPFKDSIKLHGAFVKWGYKTPGIALMLLLWLVVEQQRRDPHEVSDNATEMAKALGTTPRTIMTHLATLRRKGFLIVDEDIKTGKRFITAYLDPNSPKKEKKRLKKGRRRIYLPAVG